MQSSKPKSRKRKTSRQPSPERLPVRSPGVANSQPEAGPSNNIRKSRENSATRNNHEGRYSSLSTITAPNSGNPVSFTDGVDFVAFVPSDDEERPVRDWDKGKKPVSFDDRYDREEYLAGRKRRREESERNEEPTSSRRGVNVNNPSRKAPWTAEVDWDGCKNVAEMLHREVEAFANYISPSSIEHEVRSMVIQYISDCIRKAFPDANVLPFGSFETKLYLPGGDIDLVLQSQVIEYSGKEAVLRTLANIVKKARITNKVTIISKAKVPIIKFVTNHGRFSVDISLSQTNGVEAGRMINRFLGEMPALRALVLVIKSFLNQRSMNEVYSGGLGSYSIVCLAVSFLQMHPKLRRGEIDPSKNLGVLVMEFFELYGKYFNYIETGISLRHGGTYFSKARRGWVDSRRRFLLSIEDPGDISNDVSHGSFGIYNVRQTFAGAYEIMKSTAYIRAGILRAKQRGQAYSLRSGKSSFDRLDPDEMSILSSILGITQETINHRRLVQEVYDEGTLSQLLGRDPPRRVVELNGGNSAAMSGSTGSTPRSTQRMAASMSVRSAWDELDMELSPMSEKGTNTSRRAELSQYRDNNSRYDIDKDGPSHKRQRKGRPSDMHTVFTTDDETVGVNDSYDSEDSLAEDERVYRALDELGEDESVYSRRGASKKPLNGDVRRAYWASKSATGLEDYTDSD